MVVSVLSGGTPLCVFTVFSVYVPESRPPRGSDQGPGAAVCRGPIRDLNGKVSGFGGDLKLSTVFTITQTHRQQQTTENKVCHLVLFI